MAKKKSPKTTKVEQPHPEKEQTTRQIDEQLLLAAFRGDLSEVNACLERGADVNARDRYGYSALNEAAREGHLEVVKRLVEAGADIENTGGADITPLMSAAFAGQFDTVEFLLAKGAEVRNDLLANIQLKVNILKENAEAGMVHPEAVEAWMWFLKFLQVAQIRQVRPQTKHHSAPDAQLLKAAYEGNLNDLKMALQAGANVNVSDDQDISALRWAAQSGQSEVVKLLLDAGANINQQSASGWTALMQAVIAGSVETVSLLIERGADVNAKTFAGASALYFAHEIVPLSPDPEAAHQIVKLLKAHGAEYSAPPED
jgi:ankyrin repeat protein